MTTIQTHNISTLKSYIVTLENESVAKQSELQLVVGSKYHDFIQSGHHIESMHENAKRIEDVILQFENFNKTIIQKTSTISNLSIKSVVSLKFDLSQVNSNTIWEFLGRCDFLRATVSCLVAASILKIGGYHMLTRPVGKLNHVSLNVQEVTNLKNAVSLTQNIVDDCHLKLLDFETPLNSRAFILVSIGLLSSKIRSDLLQIYLHAVDIKLNNILTGKAYQDVIQIPKISSILQQVMIDVYYLFFHHSESYQQRGLLKEYEDIIIKGVDSSIHNFSISRTHINREVTNGSIINRTVITIPSSSEMDIENDLKRFDMWLNITALKISSKCSDLLSLLSNASDISKLQRTVYNSCVKLKTANEILYPHKNIYKNIDLKHDVLKNISSVDFIVACKYLLNPKSRIRNKVNKVENSEDSVDLWKLMFRSSFQHQVLKMLRQACESSITKIRTLMNQQIIEKQSKRKLLSSNQIYHEAEYIFHRIQLEFKLLFEASVFGSTSADIFCFGLFVEATRLIANLIIILRSLATSIVSSEISNKNHSNANNNNSNNSNNNYHNNNRTNSSHNNIIKDTNHLSSLLLIARVCYLIETRFDFFSSLFADAQFARLNGQLNLPWSAFHNYSYLEDISIKSAFEIADTNGNGLLTLTEYHEALQALGVTDTMTTSSTATANMATANTNANAYNNNNSSFSVSLLEFTLLCSHFTLVKSQEALSKLKMSMTAIVIYCHSQWSHFIAMNIFDSNLELSNKKGLLQSSSSSSSSQSFQNNDRNKQIMDDDDDNQSLSYDYTKSINHIDLSTSFLKFLFSISNQFYSKIMSMDTFQAINKQRSTNYYHDDILDSYYIQLIEKSNIKKMKMENIFQDGVIESVHSSIVYESMVQIDEYIKTIQDSLLQNYMMMDSTIIIEKCFQIVFDLTVFEFIIKSKMNSKKSYCHDFSYLLISLRAKKSQFQTHLNHQIKSVTESTLFENRAKESLKRVFFLITLFSPEKQSLDMISTDISNTNNANATSSNNSNGNSNSLPTTSKSILTDMITTTTALSHDEAMQTIFSSSCQLNRRLPLLPLPLRRN